ncbi:MAG: AMIN-like domain-containing (lipo)protein [Acidimicrobiia bacterium]
MKLRIRWVPFLVTAVVTPLALGACGSSTSTGTKPSSTSRSSSTSTTTTTTSEPCTFAGSTGRFEQPSTAAETFLLTDVEVVGGACTDTITFTFKTANPVGPPPYVIEPASPPFAQAGSGAPISVPGTKFLRVKFQPSWVADLQTGVDTYTGPHRIEPTGTVVTRGVVLYDAFEGVVGWVVGLDSSGAYRVTSAASPPSVTITVGK